MHKRDGNAYGCTPWQITGGGGLPVIADLRTNGHNQEHGDANARLIAAAPDLLEECRAVDSETLHGDNYKDFTDDHRIPVGIPWGHLKALRAALAKATK